jgi:hypothetical protein
MTGASFAAVSAQALGLSIPPALITCADQVIEQRAQSGLSDRR